MKKILILTTCLLALAPARADDALAADAQSRRDFIVKHAGKLAAGEAQAAVQISAALQVNGNAVLAALCRSSDGRDALALWGSTLLAQHNLTPLAQRLAQLALGDDGKHDAATWVNEKKNRGRKPADRVVTVSNWTRNIVIEKYGIPAEKVITVHNAVDFKAETDAKEERGIKDKIVTFLGRITLQKGPEYFVEAAAKVMKRVPNVRFVMAGSGEKMNPLVRRVAQLGLGTRFHFTGFLRGNDVQRMFQYSDVYVMPSVSEPFGISPLEAMRSGVPTIISKQSGVAEVLNHAIKVDYWDINALADAIYGILAYPTLAHYMQREGYDEVNQLKWEKASLKLKNIYESLI